MAEHAALCLHSCRIAGRGGAAMFGILKGLWNGTGKTFIPALHDASRYGLHAGRCCAWPGGGATEACAWLRALGVDSAARGKAAGALCILEKSCSRVAWRVPTRASIACAIIWHASPPRPAGMPSMRY